MDVWGILKREGYSIVEIVEEAFGVTYGRYVPRMGVDARSWLKWWFHETSKEEGVNN